MQQTRVKDYFREHASSYTDDSEHGVWLWWRAREYRAVQAHLMPLDSCSVLEVGCGSGWYARRLMNQGTRFYAASDYLPAMAKATLRGGIPSFAADLARLPFDVKFDRILCAGALEFVPRPQDFFPEAARLLKAEGKLVILAPTANLAGRFYKLWHALHGFKVHLFDRRWLERVAQASGLSLLQVSYPAAFTLVATLGVRV